MRRPVGLPALVIFPVALAVLLFAVQPGWPASEAPRLDPQAIRIGAFFGGSRVSVTGELPSGCEALIEVIGPEVEEELMRKGRHWDLWMNVGEIDIFGAPSLYYAMSSDPGLLAGSRSDLPWGYEALRRAAEFRGASGGSRNLKWFEEFVRLKEERGLYGEFPGAVERAGSAGGRIVVRGVFDFSTRIAPGSYRVCLTAVKDGRIIQQRWATLEVSLAGLPAFLSSLAVNHALFYGLLAIAIAVAAGFLSGVVFKRRRGKEHC